MSIQSLRRPRLVQTLEFSQEVQGPSGLQMSDAKARKKPKLRAKMEIDGGAVMDGSASSGAISGSGIVNVEVVVQLDSVALQARARQLASLHPQRPPFLLPSAHPLRPSMSRRDSRVQISLRQNDSHLEFESCKSHCIVQL